MSGTQYVHISLEIWGAVFCVLIAIAIYIGRNCQADKIVSEMDVMVSLLLFMDALAWYFRGNETKIGFIMVRISNILVFVLTFVVLMLFASYIVELIGGDRHPLTYTLLWGGYMLCAAGLFIAILNQSVRIIYYFDEHNFYHRAENYYLIMLVALIAMSFAGTILVLNKASYTKEEFWSLFTYLGFPVAAGIFQFFHYGIALINISIAMSVIFIFHSWEITRTRKQMEQKNKMLEQEWKMAEQEKEMNAMHQEVMLSQIQPHFLYNSLTAIAQLCEKNPHEAKKATISFANYLRGNMNALKSREPVPFEKELEHVENYFALEQMRFGDALELIYDIETMDFRVPVLTVQPIVENAVKHGIKRHGTVMLMTRELSDGYEIQIKDDGIGMNIEKKADDGKTHIGIENVRYRLKEMCGGTLTYYSEPGKGTTAIIWIPKEKMENKN